MGFVMYAMDTDDHEYWIARVMVDEKFQRKGYGRQAMKVLLERIQSDREHHMVYISFEPENETAKKLYESFGFLPDGRILEGEIVYRLPY